MRVPRVYFDGALELGVSINLDKAQSHYLGSVLRLKVGRQVLLFNGQGGEYLCSVTNVERNRVALDICSYTDVDRESALGLILQISLSKGDRFEWAIQKATELGVAQIQPIISERTEVKLTDDRLHKKVVHWRGVVKSACEQSGRTQLPRLDFPQSFTDVLDGRHGFSNNTKLILDPLGGISVRDLSATETIVLMVGPEGGFSGQEIEMARNTGYQCLNIGPRILRTETAPLAAISAIQSRFGDW